MSEIAEWFNKSLNEECGVFGVFHVEKAAELTYFGLFALQHRGQEGCGIASTNGENILLHKGEGLLTDVFNTQKLSLLDGESAIGHVRYATSGGRHIHNVQPLTFNHSSGDFALVHNGNIVNSKELKQMLEAKGSIFQSNSDTEVFAHLIIKDHKKNSTKTIVNALKVLEGSFAFLILGKEKIYACRDRHGLRPLSLGKLDGGYVLTSETAAFDVVGATFIRDLEPGEVLTIHKDGSMESVLYTQQTERKMCAMEYIYFSRPDSVIEGINVHKYRKDSGRRLAHIQPIAADIVVGVPDSSISAAMGYAEESGIPYEIGLIKNKYIGRTFIEPTQELRERAVKMKLTAMDAVVRGKRVVLVDDSIVRGTTARRIIKMLKIAGATEVHVRIASPQITHPCFYGVDMSTYDELISATKNVEQVRYLLEADSLAFLKEEDIFEVSGRSELCTACFSGKYPTKLYDSIKNANKDGKF